MVTKRTERLTIPLRELGSGHDDVALAGGKGASLGRLMSAGLNVPDAFIITTQAYNAFMHQSGLYDQIRQQLEGMNVNDDHDRALRASRIRQQIINATMPSNLTAQIRRMYRQLGSGPVGVRSSSSVEDGVEASYAGQQDTHLYIQGATNVIDTVKLCFSSLWTDRAVLYSATHGINHLEVSMAVVVQNMVTADKGVAGVMFTIDPNSGHSGMIDIGAVYGLGEGLVGGGITGDGWLVSKVSLQNGGTAILQASLGSKKSRIVRDAHGTREESVPAVMRKRYCLTDDQVREVARVGQQIEKFYGMPMDVEWAIDKDGVLWVLQARPETVASQATVLRNFSFASPPTGRVLANGVPVGNMITSGHMVIVHELTPEAMAAFPQGAILVTRHTDPNWLPLMLKADGFITVEGSRVCHAAIVAREMNKPAVVGIGTDMANLISGNLVTISCIDGKGVVYDGIHPHVETVIDPKGLPETQTKIMFNLGDPDLALERSQLPNKGVGLLRMEFIINKIGIHPMALVNYPNLEDPKVVAEIRRRIEEAGVKSPVDLYINELAAGIAMITAAFAPHDVIVRLEDLRSNEYDMLLGGKEFEKPEENPMIAFRGCDRYLDPRYSPAFALTCEAIRRVREDMKLTNLKVMLPFIRTPERGKRVIDLLAKHGLVQGNDGFQIYAMMELPTNVIRAREYAEIFDGLSIGSNDLTQLTLGVDRDSGDPCLVEVFDEMDQAVLWGMEQTITAARETGIPCGICGQGPSDRPELAAWLVERGATSLSVLPDALIKTRETVYRIEKERNK